MFLAFSSSRSWLFTKVFFCRLGFLKMPNVELRLLGAVASHRSGYTLCVFLFSTLKSVEASKRLSASAHGAET